MAEYTLHCFAQSGNAYKAALMLELASMLVTGFDVRSFGAAFIGAILLSLVNLLLRWLVLPRPRA